MSKKRKKIKSEPDPKNVGPYFYPLTGYWIQYHSKEELERRSRLGNEDGDRMFRELARSLLVGHGTIIVLSITRVANLLGDAEKVSIALPIITTFGALGVVLAGFAQLFLARHAQSVAAGYEAFRFWRFPKSAATPLNDKALQGFENAYKAFRIKWDNLKKRYMQLLTISLVLFAFSLIVAVFYMYCVADLKPFNCFAC